jgi:hypothetical protein
MFEIERANNSHFDFAVFVGDGPEVEAYRPYDAGAMPALFAACR